MPSLTYLRLHKDVQLPFRAYGESAAWDVSAHLRFEGRDRTLTLAPNSTRIIPTGLVVQAPEGHVLLVCSRSGMAVASLFVANAPGVIDPGYTGELKILLYNGGSTPMYVKHGDRIAQILVLPLTVCELEEVHELPRTERGPSGFGSTGN